MLEDQSTAARIELTQLHATTCLSMTQFINGRHCPKLAHSIVHQLGLLLAHPELAPVSDSRELYRQLLEHWQKVAAQLREQREPRPVYH